MTRRRGGRAVLELETNEVEAAESAPKNDMVAKEQSGRRRNKRVLTASIEKVRAARDKAIHENQHREVYDQDQKLDAGDAKGLEGLVRNAARVNPGFENIHRVGEAARSKEDPYL
jgi:hypothetical protein